MHAALEPVLQGPPRPQGHMLVLAAKGRLLEVWPLGGVDFRRRPRPWRVPQCSDAPKVRTGALSDRLAPSWGEFAIRDQASRTQCHELCPLDWNRLRRRFAGSMLEPNESALARLRCHLRLIRLRLRSVGFWRLRRHG